MLELARRDPFLKIEEIAVHAETTPRYVRTILSEAKVSLMELRKNYARSMQRRLNVDVTVRNQGLTDALADSGRAVSLNHLGVEKTIDPDLAQILHCTPDTPLLVVSRVRLVDGQPFFVNQVVTQRDLTVGADLMAVEKPLRQVLGLDLPGRTTFVDRSVEVRPADDSLASHLGLAPGCPVMQSGNVIVTDGERVGIEFNYFDAFRVRFVLTGASDYVLKVVEKPVEPPAAEEA